MAARTFVVMVVAAVVTTSVVAGPVSVRSWVTPKPGQTPFAPPPGVFDPELTFADWRPNEPNRIASFLPDERWASPDTPYTPGESKAGFKKYEFTYHAEVTDPASGRSAAFALDGRAEADWIQRYDGLVLPGTVLVWLEPPAVGRAAGGPFRLDVREVSPQADRIGAEVELTIQPTDTPEPGTLGLGVCGLVVAVGMWRKGKQRRAVLTPGHLPL